MKINPLLLRESLSHKTCIEMVNRVIIILLYFKNSFTALNIYICRRFNQIPHLHDISDIFAISSFYHSFASLLDQAYLIAVGSLMSACRQYATFQTGFIVKLCVQACYFPNGDTPGWLVGCLFVWVL